MKFFQPNGPWFSLLAGLSRPVIGGYLPRQGAVFVHRIWLDRRLEYPRNLGARDEHPF